MATAKKSAGAAKKSTPAKKSAGGAAAKKSAAPAKKAAAKKTGGATAKKAAAPKQPAKRSPAAAAKRVPNAAFAKPMTPSAELAAVIGNEPMPRTEVTKRVWDYIRKNNLQDQQNKRQINGDDNLRKVFGGKKSVSMFEMTKLVNQHLS